MRNDEDKTFVNRHGHRAGVTSEELRELSIDDEPVEELTPKLSAQDTPRPGFNWSKRRVLTVIGVIIVILLLPVVGGEVIAARYHAGAGSVSRKLDDIVKKDVLPAQKKTTIKSSTIATIAAQVDGLRSSICDGALFDNIAAFYPRAKTAHDSCIAKSGQLATLSSALKRLEAETRYVEGIHASTKTVTTPLSEPYAVVGAQQENWQASRDAIDKLQPPAQWQTTHKTLIGQVAAVADNWSKLNTAQNAQDKPGFQAAEKALTDSYEAIRATVTTLQGELKKTQSGLTGAYHALH